MTAPTRLLAACLPAILTTCLVSCAGTSPLDVADWRARPAPVRPDGVKVTFLGNTTLLFSDGETSLMIDGYVSRPGAFPTFFGKIAPHEGRIQQALDDAGITRIDAILVGHSHYDHALDTPIVARRTRAKVMGSTSYAQVHRGTLGEEHPTDLIVIPDCGGSRRFGRFTVTFVKSDHVTAIHGIQEKIEGPITAPVVPPTKMTDYKCGPVFAIHIAHPDGSALVTTTAGAEEKALDGFRADTVFLGIGLLGRETPCNQEKYWREVIEAVDPAVIVPVHWDSLTTPLAKGTPLKPLPKPFDDVGAAIDFLKAKTAGTARRVVAMDAFETRSLGRE